MFPLKKYVTEILSLYGLSAPFIFGLALETARVTFEDPAPAGANFPNGAAAPLGVLRRVDFDNGDNLGIPYASDAAVDIFTRYASTPALGRLANLGGNLVDVIDGAGNNTIDPLIARLRRFYATDLEGFQAAVGLFSLIPHHLCLAAVTIVSYVGANKANIPNGEAFQFSTYFLDHLFVSGDAAHNPQAVPVPPYRQIDAQADNFIFSLFGRDFPQVAFPPAGILPGPYGDPTGPSVACDTAGFPGNPAVPADSIFAFPHSPIVLPEGATTLDPLDPNVAAYHQAVHLVGGVARNNLWFSGWWYSSGQLADPAHNRHSERALCVFLESMYNLLGGVATLPVPGGGALLQAPALPAAYSNVRGATLANHPNIQPDAVEIYNAIQNTPDVVAVIIHIRNILRMCKTCADRWAEFAQGYSVDARAPATPLGDARGGRVRFVFMVGSGNGGAIEIYQ
jgi:hypothetical protein